MFYFFSKEFGWTISQILNCDIYQLDLYAKSAKKFLKKSKTFKGRHDNMTGNKINVNNINQLVKGKVPGVGVKKK